MTTAREETTRLADLLRREHHALAEFLVALAAFDRERRWVELGHASLFSFLRRELGLSAGAAQYRKTAAELVQKYPQIEAALRDGRLCLSSVIELAKVITPENAAEVLPRFFGLSSRDAAFVAASIRPVENAPRRDFLVRPVRAVAAVATTSSDRPEAPAGPPGSLELRAPETPAADGAKAAPPVASPLPGPSVPARARPAVKPLDAERARVSMTVSRRLLDKLAAARDALSHSHPGASEEEILEVGLDLILQRHAKRRGIVEKPRKRAHGGAPASAAPRSESAPSPPPPSKRTRHVPAEVLREVWKRDGGCCAWPLEGGGVCGSTYQVELDHVDGFALGAGTTVDECRLLCRVHQDVAARQLYGDALMDKYTRPKGGRCSEPAEVYGAAGASPPLEPTGLGARRPLARRGPFGRRRRAPRRSRAACRGPGRAGTPRAPFAAASFARMSRS